MYLAVTVDVEEDNWGEFTRASYTVENARRIPRLQALFDRFGVRPTYLVSHPVAADPHAVDILGRYREAGACEIGAHPHPCNTPPVVEDRTEYNSFLNNLPSDRQYEKIETLTRAIAGSFGVRPTSFRSGRWGFSEDVAGNLIRLGYTVDTSVFPMWDWTPGPDFRAFTHEPFVYETETASGEAGSLLEVPATVDFLQAPRSLALSAFHSIKQIPLGGKVLGGLKRLGVLNQVCLSPEVAEVRDMIRLTTQLAENGTRLVNLFFHSPTLLEGCTPFAATPADVDGFLSRIEGYLAFAVRSGCVPVTLSELTAKAAGATRVRALAPTDPVIVSRSA